MSESTPLVTSPDFLFENAHEHQGKLNALQDDVNNHLFGIRTSVSKVIKEVTNASLYATEDHAVKVLDLDDVVREKLWNATQNSCTDDLKTALNSATHMTGFATSNCLKAYDTNVNAALQRANSLISEYDGLSSEVLQIVVKSFIGQNLFKTPEAISDKFIAIIKERTEEWEKLRPDISSVITAFETSVAGHTRVFSSCYTNIRTEVAISYNRINEHASVCADFAATSQRFAKINIEDFLPKFA